MTERMKRYWYKMVRDRLLKLDMNFGFIVQNEEVQCLYAHCSALTIHDKVNDIVDFLTVEIKPVYVKINVSYNTNKEEIYITLKFS